MNTTTGNESAGSRSYRGEDLIGRDFSQRDIRGVDFSGARLRHASFRNARAGLRPLWQIIVVAAGAGGAAVAGLISGYAGALVGLLLFVDTELGASVGRVAALVFLAGLLGMAWLGVRYGIGRSLGLFATGLIAAAAVVAVSGAPGAAVAAIVQLFALIASIAAVMLWLLALLSTDSAGGRTAAIAVGIAGLLAAIPGILEGSSPGRDVAGDAFDLSRLLAIGVAAFVVLIVLAVACYVAWFGYARRGRPAALDRLVATWVGIGGTSFRESDLTEADFSGALLKGVDFRGAEMLRTCWQSAEGLEQARIDGSYLQNTEIRRLLLSKQGAGANFDRIRLRGLDLASANLAQASLIGADLSETTLRNADLSDARLAEAQLYQTNLDGACLTGAFIQDWAISTDTNFANIRCEYVYMRLPTADDPDPWRKPDNREERFRVGDFADFIAPIVRTLDLYRRQHLDPRQVTVSYPTLDLVHYEGIDPAVAAVTLKQLADENPTANLEVVALEGRGNEKVRLQTTVADSADRSELNRQYFERYRQNAALSEDDVHTLLATIEEKDERIRSLEEMVTSAIKSDRFYFNTYYALGDVVAHKSEISIQAEGDVSGVVGGDVHVEGGDFIGRDKEIHAGE